MSTPFIKSNRPVILTGCQSSGTGFLASLLSSHPQSAFFSELGIMRTAIIWFKHLIRTPTAFRSIRLQEYIAFVKTVRQYKNSQKKKILEKTEQVLVNYQQDGRLFQWIDCCDVDSFIRTLTFDLHTIDVDNPLFWGDKYPEYIFVLPELNQIFSEAYFIFLVRSPFSTIESLCNTRKIRDINRITDELRFSVEDARDQWVSWNMEWLNFRHNIEPERRLEIRYEDFVCHPWDALRQIEQFLGITLEEEQNIKKFLNKLDPTRLDRWKNSNWTEKITGCPVTEEMKAVCHKFGYNYNAESINAISGVVQDSDYLSKGNEHHHQVNTDQSTESHQKAIELNPNSMPAWSKLVTTYEEQKNSSEAAKCYQKIIGLQPKNHTVYLKLAKVLEKQNKIDSAIAAYQEFLNQKLPENISKDKIDKICDVLGKVIITLSIRKNKLNKAITFFQKAIEKYPCKEWSYYHLGSILSQQGQLDEAITCYKKAVEIQAQFNLSLLKMGELLLQKGYQDRAFQCGLKIIQNQGNFINGKLNQVLMRMLLVHSDRNKSKETLQKVIKNLEISNSKKKLKANTYRSIGVILRNQGEFSEAIKFCQKSIYNSLQQSKPEYVERYWDIGKLQKPNFIMLGFAKCGTTAFYDYLCQHPQVLPAITKEPMYLHDWLVKRRNYEENNQSLSILEKDLYLAHFAPRQEGSNFITGEVSTNNIFPGVEKIVSSWFPQIKLIVILREPVRRTISQYEYRLRGGSENRTLNEVINSELKELKEMTNPAKMTAEKLRTQGWKNHIAMSLYVYHLERWMKLFPREQFLILTNEDLAQYPAETMKKAFYFLGLSEYNPIQYESRNVGSYPQINTSLLSRLSEFYRPHNQRLEKLLGRKFNWEIL